MKIKQINEETIIFDNDETISFSHCQDCCEYNYADFSQIEDMAKEIEFSSPLDFEAVDEFGFRFGNEPLRMFFIPCYSDQNGYYSTNIEIYYNGNEVLDFNDNLKAY